MNLMRGPRNLAAAAWRCHLGACLRLVISYEFIDSTATPARLIRRSRLGRTTLPAMIDRGAAVCSLSAPL